MDLLRLPISKNPKKIKKRQTPEKKICLIEKTISQVQNPLSKQGINSR
jgi:hypothetical protein